MDKKSMPPELRSGDFIGAIHNSPFSLQDAQLNFNDCFFGFIDILGYKAFLDRHGDLAPRKIYAILKHCYDFHVSAYESVKLKLLSDSILIWTEGSDAIHFWNLINVIEMLRSAFLENTLMIRGGVSFGKNFIDHDIIVSPALVEAYKLEQIANYPRILISAEAYERGLKNMGKTVEGYDAIQGGGYIRILSGNKVETDRDGQLILASFTETDALHFVRTGKIMIQLAGDAQIHQEQAASLQAAFEPELTAIRDKIIAARPIACNDSRSLEKYRYLIEKFNSWLVQYGLRGQNFIISV